MSQQIAAPFYAKPVARHPLDRSNTALIIVDMTLSMGYDDGERLYGMSLSAKEMGYDPSYYTNRLQETVFPAINKVAEAFRERKMKVIYTVTGAELADFSDIVPHFQGALRQWNGVKGKKENEIYHEVSPQQGDLVVAKKGTNAFASSILDSVLRNAGIEYAVVTGVITDGCVLGTVFGAFDAGYYPIVLEDGCATTFGGDVAHQSAIQIMRNYLAKIYTADEFLGVLDELGGAGS